MFYVSLLLHLGFIHNQYFVLGEDVSFSFQGDEIFLFFIFFERISYRSKKEGPLISVEIVFRIKYSRGLEPGIVEYF